MNDILLSQEKQVNSSSNFTIPMSSMDGTASASGAARVGSGTCPLLARFADSSDGMWMGWGGGGGAGSLALEQWYLGVAVGGLLSLGAVNRGATISGAVQIGG